MAEPLSPSARVGYAELHCVSNFSFCRGASHPEELVERACRLGYAAIALTDECSLAGVARAHLHLLDLPAILEREAQEAEKRRQVQATQVAQATLGKPARPDEPEKPARPDAAAWAMPALPPLPPLPPLPRLIIGSEFAVQPSLATGLGNRAARKPSLDQANGHLATPSLSTEAAASHPTHPSPPRTEDAPPPLPAFRLVLLATSRAGYAHLSLFITALRRASPKGSYRLTADQVRQADLRDCLALLVPDRQAQPRQLQALADWGARTFGAGNVWLAVELLRELDDGLWLQRMQAASDASGVPLVAAGDVHAHARNRQPLQDVLTAIRLGRTVADCGCDLLPNDERHLRTLPELSRIYPPDLLAETLRIAERCRFSLRELSYEYPPEIVPAGHTPATRLRQLTLEGLRRRWPEGTSFTVRRQIVRELRLIAQLGYEKFFLTVEDVVRFARGEQILCQGRGSAANSAVCYCLGITEVDPSRANLLFERFISKERNEPPDIDVDFEHQRREEVIQYLYRKYGRHRTALAATVIRWRLRSAVRDVGKALGLPAEWIDALAKSHQWWESRESIRQRVRELGIDDEDLTVRQWIALTLKLIGFPRHLSQHVGGFVIAQDELGRLVPIENAAMPERTVIQWDKDDLEALGLLKVDVLALGMLTAIRRSLAFISQVRGRPFALQDIPKEDAATYEMISRADTIGVFQIESRAQMSMLPRLRPYRFYDLVVQVAIVRPGPIQGGMVHPFLTTRETGRPVAYPPALAPALARTNGVPIFQEQVMQIVMLGAGFTAGEADQLRRAMAAWKRKGGLEPFRERIVEPLARLESREYAERIFEMLKGFGEYGFPESHAASFALLAYASAWIKRHEPAAFLAGLLDAQPMGFYSPSQLVQDARRHGVEVRPVDVSFSGVETVLEPREGAAAGQDQPAVRLGLNRVGHLSRAAAERIVAARQRGAFANVDELARRATLDASDLRALAAADALQSLAGHRRQQVWESAAHHRAPVLLREAPVHEAPLALPEAPEGESIVFDYASTGLTLRRHPLALLRPQLAQRGLHPAAVLQGHRCAPGRRIHTAACGIVTMRQQPGTANGTIFVTLEDETGTVNVIVHPRLRDAQRDELLGSRLLAVYGLWQGDKGVQHLIARRLENLTPLLGRLGTSSRDFH
ncbi:MAG: error-prone DNA polymerase [Burkholderiales bacterium]|nr:error-prone DNA polymerase [Burkholderiales bacterium]